MINGPRLPLKPSYQDLAGFVKDMRELLAQIPDQRPVEFTGQYIEGFTLKLPTAPKAIELVRCTIPNRPGQLTNHGSTVEWTWTAAGARIDRIEGLTVGTTIYDLLFRVTYNG